MEGCSKYCTYCVVPFTRGEEISRPLNDVLAEITTLASQGVKEVNLLGQNVNAYRGAMADGEIAGFALLLHYVAAIDGIERIRFTTSHPMEFTDDIIDAYTEIPKLVSHLHLPVQSGSNRILAAMKRGYNREEYLEIIRKIQAARPGISLSSDFIVGFPGETEADFADTMALIDEVGFDFSYSFVFSARPGTPAAELADDMTLAEKEQRLQILKGRLNDMTMAISEQMIGTVQKVLAEGVSKKNPLQLTGRTENNRVLNFAAHPRLIGQFLDVLVMEALPNSLRGRVVESSINQLQS
jgi:tRNA-2-methylthio-N6-dimethylallyladenosine synthase